ncbi:MAG: HD domain-containing protein [Ardenticatenia bacterium]|nr:MAG: HD domain-containing protein [Ardenticatenia bacterium]
MGGNFLLKSVELLGGITAAIVLLWLFWRWWRPRRIRQQQQVAYLHALRVIAPLALQHKQRMSYLRAVAETLTNVPGVRAVIVQTADDAFVANNLSYASATRLMASPHVHVNNFRVDTTPLDAEWQQIFTKMSLSFVAFLRLEAEGGVLALLCSAPMTFDSQTRLFFESVRDEIGSGLKHIRLLETLHTRLDYDKRLRVLSNQLNRTLSEEQVVRMIGGGALNLIAADGVAVYVRLPNNRAYCAWAYNVSPHYIQQILRQLNQMPGNQLVKGTEPILISDVRMLPETSPLRHVALENGIGAVGLWPLVYEGATIAALGTYFREPHVWTPEEQDALMAYARQAAIALENARHVHELRQRVRELTNIATASELLRVSTEVDAIAQVVCQQVHALTDVDFVFFIDPPRDNHVLHIRHVAGTLPSWLRDITLPLQAANLHEMVAQLQEPNVFFNPHRHPLLKDFVPPRVGYLVVVPLRDTQGELVGVLVAGKLRRLDNRYPQFSEIHYHMLTALAEMAGAALERARMFGDLEQAYFETVLALVKAIESRDHYTASHSEFIAHLAEATARQMGLREEEVRQVYWAALLHDVGKIAVPDHILRKPAALTDEEWRIMQKHPEWGARIVEHIPHLQPIAAIIRSHHERFDGRGYPHGLRGDQIPLAARIIAVADAFSAMVENRVYQKARTADEALAELQRCAGTHFDPQVVDVFERVVREWYIAKEHQKWRLA